MNLSKEQINWIANEYRAGRELDEIKIDTGLSLPTVKRALAEAGELSLKWHKTPKEHELISYLKTKGINSVADIKLNHAL